MLDELGGIQIFGGCTKDVSKHVHDVSKHVLGCVLTITEEIQDVGCIIGYCEMYCQMY